MTKLINKYSLPASRENITRIVSDPISHVGWSKYAIDFSLLEGCSVNAAADGKVIYIKTDSNQGGDDSKYENFKFYNHIVIKHKNGEYTEYGHLKQDGSDKKIGDIVKKGDKIALSGNTGWSSEPHIHFAVFKLTNMLDDFDALPKEKIYFIDDEDFGYQTIEAHFDEKINIIKE